MPRRHPHRSHRLLTPLPRAQKPAAPELPRGCFGSLTGTFDHAAAGSRYRTAPDDNHVYLWVRLGAATLAPAYECAVNVASPAGPRLFTPVLFHERDELIPATDLPAEGFTADARCSYAALGLRESDFTAVPQLTLGPVLIGYAQSSLRMAVYGVTYENGEGLHDIHLNSHEMPGSLHRDRLDAEGRPTQDGALIFYSRAAPDDASVLRAHGIFLKFRTQLLRDTSSPA